MKKRIYFLVGLGACLALFLLTAYAGASIRPVDSASAGLAPSDGLRGQGVFDRTWPVTTTTSPVWWDTPPKSGSIVILSSGEEIILPGPDDKVRVIILLEDDAVSVYKSRLEALPGPLTTAQRDQIRAYAGELRRSHERFVGEIRAQGIELELRREYTYILNGLAGSVKMADMKRIEALPQVRAVYRDYQVQALLDDSVPLIGAPNVWAMTDANGQPVTGRGIRVAVIDTGIDYTHPDLGGGFGPDYKVIGGYDFVNDDADPWDDNGHGTHCAGIVAANGAVKGVAPDASLYGYKVLDEYGSGWQSDVIAGIERATNPDRDPTTDDAVEVISMSLGGPGDPDEALALAVDTTVDQGVVVAAAAGNSGPDYQTVSSPGVARKAFTVGATDKSDNLAAWSSRGPVMDFYELIKPDLVAPGVSIRSTVPISGELGSPDRYLSLSGTSMATPHIAGAAALIKQLHPDWTPEMMKANLMNTARDLGLDVFTQGAGRVQVDDAALAPGVLSPGSLGLGLVDVNQPLWTQTKNLTLTNVATASVHYSLSITGTLPAGVTTTVHPPDVTLGAGESVTVTFSITVDNAVTPYQDEEPGSYEGQVIAQPAESGAEPLVVPFAFIKSPRLEMTFDEDPFWVVVHNGEDAWGRPWPGTSLTMLLPSGTYDVWVAYNDIPFPLVIREGVVVSEVTSLSISRSDAVHTITLAPRDKDGQAMAPQDLGFTEYFEHIPSGISSQSFSCCRLPLPLQLHFSEVSTDYAWEWRLDTAWDSDWYEFNDILTGISGDSTYENDPGTFRHVVHQWHPGPSQSYLGINRWVHRAVPPYGYQGFGSSGLQETLSDPFVKHAYYVPFSNHHYRYTYIEARDPDSDEVLHASPYLVVKAGGGIDGYLLFVWDALFTTTGQEFHLGQVPPHWFGSFSNSHTQVSLEPALTRWASLFLYQGWDRRPYDALPYRLYQGGTLIESGTLPAASGGWAWTEPVYISLPSSGAYTFSVTYDQYRVDGQPGQARMVADFDTTRADKDPPTLLSLNVLYDGETTDLVPPSTTSKVRFRVQDVGGLSEVSLFYKDDGDWIPLSLTRVGDEYTAQLPGFGNGIYVSLKIVAQDTAGNSLTYEVVPAFKVGLPPPTPTPTNTPTPASYDVYLPLIFNNY